MMQQALINRISDVARPFKAEAVVLPQHTADNLQFQMKIAQTYSKRMTISPVDASFIRATRK